MKNAGNGALQKSWRRLVHKSTQRRDIAGKTQQTLSHEEAIKGKGESNFDGSKILGNARI